MSMLTSRICASAIIGALLTTLSGCVSAPAGVGLEPSPPAQGSLPSPAVTPQESVAADSPDASADEAAHEEQMRQLHHQGYSRHEFRAFHNMEEMHRMGGVPDMPPLDEYKINPSSKMGESR